MSDLKDGLLKAIYQGVSLRKLDKVPTDSTNWFKATANGDVYEFVIELGPIKQAFIDAGWVKPVKYFDEAKIDEHNILEPIQLMTGQQWLDRFEAEFTRLVFDFDSGVSATDIPMLAAKKASGIQQ